MSEPKRHPINLTLTIEPASIKKIVEQGRLMEFADALSTLAAAHIKAELVDKVARAGSGAVSVIVGFDDDDRYGTPPRPWPWPKGIWEDALREVAIKDVVNRYGR
jgi:hypothetical protein